MNSQDSDSITAALYRQINSSYMHMSVTSCSGRCPYGHQTGDTFMVTTMNSGGLCGSLYQSIFPLLMAVEYGSSVPWRSDQSFSASCPEKAQVTVTTERRNNPDPSRCIKTPSSLKSMDKQGVEYLKHNRVRCEILDIANTCMWGHSAGDSFEVDPFNVNGMCGMMYWGAYAFICMLVRETVPPWSSSERAIVGVCPDPFNQLSYRLVLEQRNNGAGPE